MFYNYYHSGLVIILHLIVEFYHISLTQQIIISKSIKKQKERSLSGPII